MVRCKFTVGGIKFTMGSKGQVDAEGKPVMDESGRYQKQVPCRMASIEMYPVYSTDPNSENKKFWDASPGGAFTLNCVNEAAVAQLELGKAYYLDISPAPDA